MGTGFSEVNIQPYTGWGGWAAPGRLHVLWVCSPVWLFPVPSSGASQKAAAQVAAQLALAVKEVVRFPGAGGGGGLPRDWCTTCSCSFSPWTAQKSKFSKRIFLIPRSPEMTIQDMQKHVLGSVYVFITLFGYWARASQGIGTQSAYAVFHLGQLKNRTFRNLDHTI